MAEPARLPLTFEDVAIYFFEQEWQILEAWQKQLYQDVMRTNYETLISLDGGLRKPELISCIEQGREPFSPGGESRKPGNVLCSSADVRCDPVIESQLFEGSQPAVKSKETKCHFQLDPPQSQTSFGAFAGEREDVCFRPDEVITPMSPKGHNPWALAAVVRSSSKSAHREGLPGHSALGPPGLPEVPSWQSTQHPSPVCKESFWEKDHLAEHQKSHAKGLSHGAWKTFSQQADMQPQQGVSDAWCPEYGYMGNSSSQFPECQMHFRHEQALLSHGLMCKGEQPSHCPRCDQSFLLRDSAQVSQSSLPQDRTASRVHSVQEPGPDLNQEKRCHPEGGLEVVHRSHSQERPCSCWEKGGPLLPRFQLTSPLRAHLRKEPFQDPDSDKHVCQGTRGEGREERPFSCRKRTKGVTKEHTRGHSAEKPFGCAKCGKSFCRRGQLLRHHWLHSSAEKPFTCLECGLNFRRRSALRAHRCRHSGQRPFSCSECGRGFTHQCKLREHLRVHSGEKPFACPECDKRFRLKGTLKVHQGTHSAQRPFPCPQCGKGFTRQSTLTEHLRVHSGERPFPCPQCDRSFRLKGQLLSHQRLHTGERPFQCPECDKSYRAKGDMKAHQLVHHGQMPFSCDCGKGFAKHSRLVEHIRTHTGEKPFQCPKCDKRFRLKGQLHRHQRLHTGERPFHCPECDKNFRERGHMLRHQRIHRPERPFACGDCGKGFIYRSKLAEHMRVHRKSCRPASREPDIQKRLSQLYAMIEADWS